MAYSNQFYSSYLESTRTTFENIPQFPDFQAAVAGHGYGDVLVQRELEISNTRFSYLAAVSVLSV